ncbi:hypothetical protein GCM10027167_01150 [Nocardia heshunensis]
MNSAAGHSQSSEGSAYPHCEEVNVTAGQVWRCETQADRLMQRSAYGLPDLVENLL